MTFTIKKPNKLKRDDIFVILYLLSFFLRFFLNIETTITGFLLCLSGILCTLNLYAEYRKYRRIILLLFAIICVGIINALLSKNDTVIDVLYLFVPQIFGFYIYERRQNLDFIKTFLLIIFWYISFRVVFAPSYNDVGDITISKLCGKNSISIMMAFAYSVDLIDREGKNKKPNYIYPVVGILVSYLTDSSGGILTFIIIGLGVFDLKNKKKIAWKRILIFGTIAAAVLVIGGYYIKIIEFLSDDNSRFWIWSHYLDCSTKNISSFLFGGNVSNVAFLIKQKNMHNTFINWHYRAGLIPCVIYLVTLIYIGIETFKRKEWFYFLIWLATTVRSVTDGTDYCFMSLWVFLYIKITFDRYSKKNNIIETSVRRTSHVIKSSTISE